MTPGDIVRHADYPQWGCGYVIRAKKASSDVFFRWGGKRRIDAGEPLEGTRATRVEGEFFALCAGLSATACRRRRGPAAITASTPSSWIGPCGGTARSASAIRAAPPAAASTSAS